MSAISVLPSPLGSHKPPRYAPVRGKSTSDVRPVLSHSAPGEREDYQNDKGKGKVGKAKTLTIRSNKSAITLTSSLPEFPFSQNKHAPSSSFADLDFQFDFGVKKETSPRKREGPTTSESLPLLPSTGNDSQLVQFATAITADEAVTVPIDVAQARVRRDHQPAPVKEVQQEPTQEKSEWLADEVLRLEAETDRILAEQHKKDLARLATPSRPATASSTTATNSVKSPVSGRFPFLSRARKANGETPISPSSSLGVVDCKESSISAAPADPRLTAAAKGPTPPLDPAISASASGIERRVLVHCRGLKLEISVANTAATLDIIHEFSQQSQLPLNAEGGLLVEIYSQLGIERRLRRYEPIWSVLNSWDQDSQNSLLILPDSSETAEDLSLADVPTTDRSPKGITLQLYHSQRPGKWNKRYVTLLSGGQIFTSKKLDPQSTDKDILCLCHLSDFDIYTPTEAQLRRQLKPPKKYCYAIKSQQKTTSIAQAENYIHFFSTDDLDIAQQFHSAVHAWRSWYLVNRTPIITKRRGPRPPPPPPPSSLPPSLPPPSLPPSTVKGDTAPAKVSVTPLESSIAVKSDEPKRDQTKGKEEQTVDLTETGVEVKSAEVRVVKAQTIVAKTIEVKSPSKPKKVDKPPQIITVKHKPKKSISHVKIQGHRVRVSVDESPYVIGEFAPLIDLERFNKPLDDFGKDWELDMARQSAAYAEPPRFKERPKLPSVRESAKAGPVKPSPLLDWGDDDTFAAGGLLGSAYNARAQATKEAQKKGSDSPTVPAGPFVQGANLLNGGLSTSASPVGSRNPSSAGSSILSMSYGLGKNTDGSSWLPSASQHTAQVARSRPGTGASTQQASDREREEQRRRNQRFPAPLVDLTPGFVEAPQWSRDNVGRGVRAPQGTRLVDLATNTNPAVMREHTVAPLRLTRRETSGSSGSQEPHHKSKGSSDSGSGDSYRQREASLSVASPSRKDSRGHVAPQIPPLTLGIPVDESAIGVAITEPGDIRTSPRQSRDDPAMPTKSLPARTKNGHDRGRTRLNSDTTLRF